MQNLTPFRAFIRFTTPAALALLALLIPAIHVPYVGADGPRLAETPIVAEIRSLINNERQARGLLPLEETTEVDGVAVARALDMASLGYLDHLSPSGTNAVQLLNGGAAAAAYIGENIGRSAGYTLEEAVRVVCAAWMASAGHRENVLDPRFRRVGVAVAISDAVYFVAVFAD
jgi:uncharacterized protein YkwD